MNPRSRAPQARIFGTMRSNRTDHTKLDYAPNDYPYYFMYYCVLGVFIYQIFKYINTCNYLSEVYGYASAFSFSVFAFIEFDMM